MLAPPRLTRAHEQVRGQADALVATGLAALGYTYVNIDCGWSLPARSPNGTVVPDPGKFPDGIAGVAAYVHAKGLRLGLYSEHAHVDCCGGPGMLGYEATDAQTFAAWGVDYLKVGQGEGGGGDAWRVCTPSGLHAPQVDSCDGHDYSPFDQVRPRRGGG
jgi:alpha-galactosidase